MGEPKERPILMNAAMVRAVMAGRKTQTRRTVKPQPSFEGQVPNLASCPFGVAGDRLWVREAWAAFTSSDYWTGECDEVTGPPSEMRNEMVHIDQSDIVYAADGVSHPDRWRPSIHMPRWASRIELEITGVRVERLQEITEEDARAEGVEHVGARLSPNTCIGQDQTLSTGERMLDSPYRAGFAWLWDELYGDTATWKSNPFVWRVEFRRVERAARAA